MAKIPMASGFTPIDEGEYIFQIYQVEDDETFGIYKVHLVTADGLTHVERFYILNDDGSIREGALGRLSYLAKCALNDFDRDGDWATQEIVGCYIRGEIVHKATESTKTTGKTVTFVNLGEINPAEGFDTEISEKAQKIIDKGKAAGTSLSDLLG